MSYKNNIKYYEKIIMLEDEIYDSDAWITMMLLF